MPHKTAEAIHFERASPDDWEVYCAVEKSIPKTKTYSAILDTDEAIREIETSTVYFIKHGEVLAGSIQYQMKASDHAYISGLVVKPEFQGRGIGRRAVMRVLEELKDVRRIDLVTHPHNTPAILLYLSLGFNIESWKDNYFGDGEPRIVLVKNKQ